MKFRISPQAFFQVNTLGAEVLYQAAIELAHPTEESAVIDVCCGTGTIGLTFSKVRFILKLLVKIKFDQSRYFNDNIFSLTFALYEELLYLCKI